MDALLNPPGPSRLIGDVLTGAVADNPDGTAVRDLHGGWTYRELDRYADAVACWLQSLEVRPGDRVVTHLPSRRDLVALLYGTARAGAVFVPLNPAVKEFHLAPVLADAEPALVVGAGEMVPEIAGMTPAAVRDMAVAWPEVAALADARAAPEPVRQAPDDLGVLVYTSGSTAAPKAVMGPHAQVVFAARAIQAVLGYRCDDVVFCRFPISWDYGLYKVLLAALGRSALVLAGEESDLLLLRRMREVGATVVPIVPSLATMILSLAQRDDGPPPPIRMFSNTGAALPGAVIDALRTHFPGARVVRQFGQTECKRISIMPPERDTERPASVGLPLPGTSVRILDRDGRPLPPGEIGEIVACGPHVMPGYWRAPEASERTFRRDQETGELRLHTGDYGSLDADGYLYFDGRRDDVFKRKGIRMSTVEIEAAAVDIPGVRTAAVVPPVNGRDLAIFVESELAPNVVLKELAKRLEPLKVPSICRVLDSLPLTPHGKNARNELVALLTGEAG